MKRKINVIFKQAEDSSPERLNAVYDFILSKAFERRSKTDKKSKRQDGDKAKVIK